MGRFLKECYGKLILPVLAAGAAGFFLCNKLILIEGWTGVIIKACVASAVYVLVMFSFLNRQEKEMIIGLLKRNR